MRHRPQPACTVERFQRDIAKHEMTIVHEQDEFRHLRFKRPDTYNMHFDITTWPGYLCFSGDMGCYVFTRLRDMLQFFRMEQPVDPRTSIPLIPRINPSYWAEKCEAEAKNGGVFEFDPAQFERFVTEERRRFMVRNAKALDKDTREELWEEIGELKSTGEGEHVAWAKLRDWSTRIGDERVGIEGAWDDPPNCRAFTFRYLWCCYAIAWAVQTYDIHKLRAAAQETPAS